MASSPAGSCSLEYRTFRTHFDRLVDAVTPNIGAVAGPAFAKNLITSEHLQEAINAYTGPKSKTATLLLQILSKIELNRAHFTTFVGILKSVPVLEELADELMAELRKLQESKDDSTFEPARGPQDLHSNMIETVESKRLKLDASLAEISECSTDITVQRDKIEKHICNRIEQLHQTLGNRKIELIAQLDQITKHKITNLEAQKTRVQKMKSELEKKGTVCVLPEAAALEPVMRADITFAVSKTTNTTTLCGQLCTPIPGRCRSTLQIKEFCIVGEESVATLEVSDSDGRPISHSEVTICSGELVSDITNVTLDVAITKTEVPGEGRYEIKFTPTIKGRYKLHIKMNHQEIDSSPFTVKVRAKDHLKSLDGPITSYKDIRTPHGVMLSQHNEVIVTQWRDNCISIITPGENMPHSFDARFDGITPGVRKPYLFATVRSKNGGEFDHPHQVTQDRHGNFYVTDFFNNRIQKFSPDWVFITAVNAVNHEGCTKNFNQPSGIAYNTVNGKLYVVEEGNHCIRILNTKDLSCEKTFGTYGGKEGELNTPWGIAFDSRGKVYVTDRLNKRIQVFEADGKYVKEITCKIDGKDDSATEPGGIAIDADDNIYVSFSGKNYRIAVFNLNGDCVKVFGSCNQNMDVAEMRYRGITVDDCGVVYVCNESGNSVLLF